MTPRNDTSDWERLLSAYQTHLDQEKKRSFSHRANDMRFTKIFLLDTLKEGGEKFTQRWLDDPFQHQNQIITYAQFLAQRRTAWPYLILQISFIALTFPISLPILMLWSLIKRGTWQFWKTDGQLFVTKLQSIVQANQDTKPETDNTHNKINRIYSPGSTPMQSTRSKKTVKPPKAITLEPESHQQDELLVIDVVDTSQKPSLTTLPDHQSTKGFGFFNNSFIDGNLHAILTGTPDLREFDLFRTQADEPNLPDIIKLNLRYELRYTAPADRLDLFSPEQLDILRKENPDLNLNLGLMRHLTLHFFAEVPPVRPVFNDAPLAPMQAAPIPIQVATTQHKSSSSNSIFKAPFAYVKRKFHSAPPRELSFDELVAEQKYEQAFKKASTNTQITTMLEAYIEGNCWGYKELLMDKKSFEDCARLNDHNNNADYIDTVKRMDETIAQKLQRIHTLINQLPDQYWLHSKPIVKITANFRHIMDLILHHRFEEAFTIFSKEVFIPEFIRYTAPHLIAWNDQLILIFGLLRRTITKLPEPNDPDHKIWHVNMTDESNMNLTMKRTLSYFNHHPDLAAYFDKHTVQVFQPLIDEERIHQKKARENFGFVPREFSEDTSNAFRP